MPMASRRERIAVYPGTFDPLTIGHLSLVRRALRLVDRVIVAVARETTKQPMFDLEERVAMAGESFADEPRVTVEGFQGLLMDYVKSCGATAIVRGLRAVSDFDFEMQMALMNRRLDKNIETFFLMTDFRWLFISSTIIKEVARSGGEVGGLVPEPVHRRLRERFQAKPDQGA